MTFNLTIDIGNDAMQHAQDIADALRKVAASLESGGYLGQPERIRDAYGNVVGSYVVVVTNA